MMSIQFCHVCVPVRKLIGAEYHRYGREKCCNDLPRHQYKAESAYKLAHDILSILYIISHITSVRILVAIVIIIIAPSIVAAFEEDTCVMYLATFLDMDANIRLVKIHTAIYLV